MQNKKAELSMFHNVFCLKGNKKVFFFACTFLTLKKPRRHGEGWRSQHLLSHYQCVIKPLRNATFYNFLLLHGYRKERQNRQNHLHAHSHQHVIPLHTFYTRDSVKKRHVSTIYALCLKHKSMWTIVKKKTIIIFIKHDTWTLDWILIIFTYHKYLNT